MNDMFKQREAFISHLPKKNENFAFNYICSHIWNLLSKSIHQAKNVSCFKKLINGQCDMCHVVMSMNMCHYILLVYYGYQVFHLYMCMSCLKPQSHRIVRFFDRTIGCDLVSYDPATSASSKNPLVTDR